MAVKMNKQARRLAVFALAISAVTLPGVASADPDNGGRGEWRTRSDGGGHQARTEGQDNDGGWRARQAPQQQEQPRAAPAPQAVPQAQANWQARDDRGNRGGDQGGGERRNWNGSQAAPQAVPVPQPAQQGWNGGNRQDRGQTPGWTGGNRQQTDQARTWNRDGDRGGNRDGQVRNWTEAGRQNHDGDRRQQNDGRTRDRIGGYVQGGTYYGNSGGYNRDSRNWNRDRDHDGDRDGRNWNRDRDHDGDRDGHQRNRQWRNNSSYNWYSYRSSHPSYYRLGSYYSPYRNYSYRRLNVGFFLDQLFFGQNYWIDDPQNYRLPDVYGPYRWVRYYDDAVLVDIYSGEVADVIYNFFW